MIIQKMDLHNKKKIRLFKQGIELFDDDMGYLKTNDSLFVSEGIFFGILFFYY